MIAALIALLAVVNNPVNSVTYACDGVTAAYTVNFPYLSSGDLVVTSTTAAGAVTTLVQTTDWSVNLSSTSSTASLTLNSPATKCPAGNTFKIARNTGPTQPTSFRQQNTYSPSVHEQAFDRATMLIQEGLKGVTAPLSGAGTALSPLLMSQANSTHNGFLSAADWSAFSAGPVGSNTYTAPFAGAVPQLVSAKLAEVISLKDAGAPCDGTSDDSVALGKAITALPSNGGVVDARMCRSGMALNAMSISKNGVTVLFPSATIKLNGYLDVLAFGVHLVGAGMATTIGSESTTFTVATTAGIRYGAAGTNIWNWSLEKVSLTPQAAATPAFGVQLLNAREGFLDHVATSSFTAANAAGVLQLANCWSNRYVEVKTTSNDLGFAYEGDQPNADVHIGGMYSSNRIGIYVAIGAGTTAGIFVTGSPQFEGNTDSGIKLESGNINGFHVAGAYSELLSGAKRLLTAKGDGVNVLRLSYLDVSNTSILAGGTVNPVLLDSTANASDFINAHVEALSYSMTGGATAIVDAIGTSTVVQVEGKALSGVTVTPFHTTASSAKALSRWFDAAGMNFKNAADTTLSLNIDSGATAGQSSVLSFKDRGTSKHQITSVGGSLFVGDLALPLNKIVLGAGNAPTTFNSAGANAVQVNATANSGSTGFEVWSGGAVPTKILTLGGGAGTTFATLGAPANGTIGYCSDCTIANPCAGGGTGAIAKRLNGVWVCN